MSELPKTLIGKDNYLFLQNDSAKELEVHCRNLCLVTNDFVLYRRYLAKGFITIFPNKSLMCKQYLPDGYVAQYRPGFEKYKTVFCDKLLDGYEVLKDLENCYYKTDTHINLYGGYKIYEAFVKAINLIYPLNIQVHPALIQQRQVDSLSGLSIGIGDLTWDSNLGTQTLANISDTYYYSTDFEQTCHTHRISMDDIQLVDEDLINVTTAYVDSAIDWNIISKFILYKKTDTLPKLKVIIFYDSLLISTMSLYLSMFSDVFMIKQIFNESIISKINPDYIFEFRCERFLF